MGLFFQINLPGIKIAQRYDGDCLKVVRGSFSREAAEALTPSFVPVDHAIVALVDQVDGTPVS